MNHIVSMGGKNKKNENDGAVSERKVPISPCKGNNLKLILQTQNEFCNSKAVMKH